MAVRIDKIVERCEQNPKSHAGCHICAPSSIRGTTTYAEILSHCYESCTRNERLKCTVSLTTVVWMSNGGKVMVQSDFIFVNMYVLIIFLFIEQKKKKSFVYNRYFTICEFDDFPTTSRGCNPLTIFCLIHLHKTYNDFDYEIAVTTVKSLLGKP